MIRYAATASALVLAAVPALAHPGHLGDTAGFGHSHYLDIAILIGVAVASACWGTAVLLRSLTGN